MLELGLANEQGRYPIRGVRERVELPGRRQGGDKACGRGRRRHPVSLQREPVWIP